MPIKIVGQNLSCFKQTVVKGSDIVPSILATVPETKHNKKANRVLQVLCDSGSEGNILFVREGTKRDIPFKERYVPQQCCTTNGTFKTTHVGKDELFSCVDAYVHSMVRTPH